MKINLKEFKRFEKQIILKNIGINGQKKIFNSRVLVIGIGGLGSPLLTYLATSGVGTIGIVDFDKVELSNLNRQTLFVTKDIGKFKVNQAKTYISKLNKKIRVKVYKKKITASNIKSIIKNFDIICDGTDNFDTRYLINDQCKKSKKLLISKSEVRIAIKNKGIKINNSIVDDDKLNVNLSFFEKNLCKISFGKKKHLVVKLI